MEQLDDLPMRDMARDPEALARFAEEWAILKQAIASLPERERAALEMRELEELSSAEVAARFAVLEKVQKAGQSGGAL